MISKAISDVDKFEDYGKIEAASNLTYMEENPTDLTEMYSGRAATLVLGKPKLRLIFVNFYEI